MSISNQQISNPASTFRCIENTWTSTVVLRVVYFEMSDKPVGYRFPQEIVWKYESISLRYYIIGANFKTNFRR